MNALNSMLVVNKNAVSDNLQGFRKVLKACSDPKERLKPRRRLFRQRAVLQSLEKI